MLADTWNGTNQSLLEYMSSPDTIFMKALEKFKVRLLVGNLLWDYLVPYCTANIWPCIPSSESKLLKATPISEFQHVYSIHDDLPNPKWSEQAEMKSFYYENSTEFRMIQNLRRLSWTRVDVLFKEQKENPHDYPACANGSALGEDVLRFTLQLLQQV